MFVKKRLALSVAAVLTGLVVNAQAGTLQFEGVDYPETDAEKRSVLASETVYIDGEKHDIGFNVILRSGEGVKKGKYLPFGTVIDKDGEPLKAADGSDRISSSNDFNSLLNTEHGLFMVSHFETRPGAMYVTALKQTNKGHLEPKWTKPIDFSEVEGGWVHCAGSVTPWETHLGSEEYEPDAVQWLEGNTVGSYEAAMADYYGEDADPKEVMNPYDYGYPVEVKILDEKGNAEVTKHYAMGRLALELAYVMPDQKTAYLTDDGTNTSLYMFVADYKGDLSSGTLYGAKVKQKKKTYGHAAEDTSFKLEWISLGKASNAQIASAIDSGTMFSEIFDSEEPVDGKCSKKFTSINAGHRSGNHQCLKVKPGMKQAASRLETRRYGAMLGVTTEFRKMEGITFNPEGSKLYLAMSETARGMEDNMKNGVANDSYDIGGPNHIRVAYNTCGGVYEMDVNGKGKRNRVSDVNGKRIKSAYVATNLVPIPELFGTMGGESPNKCDVDGLANPDNVSYLPGYNTLIVGEDTGSGHQNDLVWSFDIETRELTRIQTTPYGSETTSPYWYPNVNGWGYLMTVIQHPFGESDPDKYLDGGIVAVGADRGYSAYIGPFPALDNDQ